MTVMAPMDHGIDPVSAINQFGGQFLEQPREDERARKVMMRAALSAFADLPGILSWSPRMHTLLTPFSHQTGSQEPGEASAWMTPMLHVFARGWEGVTCDMRDADLELQVTRRVCFRACIVFSLLELALGHLNHRARRLANLVVWLCSPSCSCAPRLLAFCTDGGRRTEYSHLEYLVLSRCRFSRPAPASRRIPFGKKIFGKMRQRDNPSDGTLSIDASLFNRSAGKGNEESLDSGHWSEIVCKGVRRFPLRHVACRTRTAPHSSECRCRQNATCSSSRAL